MNVVAHNDIRVEMVMAKGAISIFNSFDYHVGDLRLAKIKWACPSVVENAIHSQELLSGGSRRREHASCRKAIVQAPGDEHGLANRVIMRQSASVKRYQHHKVHVKEKILRPLWAGWHPARRLVTGASGADWRKWGRLTIGRRLTTCPTAQWQTFFEITASLQMRGYL